MLAMTETTRGLHQPPPPQARRRSGRPKPIPFTYIPPEDQKEYYELSLNGAPTEAEAMLGGLTGYYDTGGRRVA